MRCENHTTRFLHHWSDLLHTLISPVGGGSYVDNQLVQVLQLARAPLMLGVGLFEHRFHAHQILFHCVICVGHRARRPMSPANGFTDATDVHTETSDFRECESKLHFDL